MNDAELKVLFARMAITWPNWRGPTSDEKIGLYLQVYRELLGDLPAGAVYAAVQQYATTADGRQYPPSPGQLRELVIIATDPSPPPDHDQAWAEVMEQIGRVGYLGEPTFSHPAIADVVRSLGWIQLCESTNQVADRAHFGRMYDNAATRHRPSPVPPMAAEVLLALPAGFSLALEP